MNNINPNQSFVDLVLSFFNQYLFQDVKNNISDVKYYFQTNPATSGNPLVEQLLGAIKDYSLENIGLPLFESILLRTNKTEEERRELLGKIVEFKKYSKDEIEPSRKYLRDLVASVYISRANKLYSESPSEFLGYLKQSDFKSTGTDYLNSVSFDDIDINTIIAENAEPGLTSSFEFINNSFTEGAYKKGDIVIVSAPPSVGKSLIAETEALHFAINHKAQTNMLIMGDLDMSSLLIRLAAIYSGLPFREARRNIGTLYKELREALGGRLDVIIAPSGKISAKEYVSYILNHPKKYKAVLVDYDENFAVDYTGAGGGMYSEFSDIYNEFTVLKEAGILTEILCQPKVFTWNSEEETINLDSLGNSSRKGHIADVVVTVKKRPGNMNGLCVFNIAKNRHGYNEKAYAIRLGNGRFKIIPKEIYNDLAQIQDHHEFLEGEIDMRVQQFLQSRKQVTQQVNQKLNLPSSTPSIPKGGPTPF